MQSRTPIAYAFQGRDAIIHNSFQREVTTLIDTVALITVRVGRVNAVAKALEKIQQIEKVLVVTGPYDVVALAELPSKSQYRPFINAIHEIEGIMRTETCLAI